MPAARRTTRTSVPSSAVPRQITAGSGDHPGPSLTCVGESARALPHCTVMVRDRAMWGRHESAFGRGDGR
ncbi:MAG: hypothetical protein QOG22_1901 [Pseudonocardiales bacterium]|nr:hypothetical protein [Pseudonocardiales bacterium]